MFRTEVEKETPRSLVNVIVYCSSPGRNRTGEVNLRQLGTHALLNELRQNIQRAVCQQIVLQSELGKVWVETEGKVGVKHGESLIGKQFAYVKQRDCSNHLSR